MTSPTPSQHCQPMTAHTPTPWRISNQQWEPWEGAVGIEGTHPSDFEHDTVCWTTSGGTENQLANVAFIVEACNSYETLKRRIAVLEMVIAEELYPSDCRDEANAMIVEQIVGGAKA